MMRKELFGYVKKKYKADPEYLWSRFPDYAIFRHSDNKKWFGLVMNVRKEKLGLDGEDMVDILNVKLSDPLLVDMLIRQSGYMRGYHISRGNWVSILLDGSVPFEEICGWLNESYHCGIAEDGIYGYETNKALVKALHHFTFRKHEIVVLHVMAEEELTFGFDGHVHFENLEGPDEMMIDAKSIRASYLEQVNAFLKKIGDGVRKTGADYAPMNTKIPFDKALVEYLSRRRSGGR